MPVFSYYCEKCNKTEDRLRNPSDTEDEKCETCSSIMTRTVEGGGHFNLKGPGFYGTDYGGPTSR